MKRLGTLLVALGLLALCAGPAQGQGESPDEWWKERATVCHNILYWVDSYDYPDTRSEVLDSAWVCIESLRALCERSVSAAACRRTAADLEDEYRAALDRHLDYGQNWRDRAATCTMALASYLAAEDFDFLAIERRWDCTGDTYDLMCTEIEEDPGFLAYQEALYCARNLDRECDAVQGQERVACREASGSMFERLSAESAATTAEADEEANDPAADDDGRGTPPLARSRDPYACRERYGAGSSVCPAFHVVEGFDVWLSRSFAEDLHFTEEHAEALLGKLRAYLVVVEEALSALTESHIVSTLKWGWPRRASAMDELRGVFEREGISFFFSLPDSPMGMLAEASACSRTLAGLLPISR